MKQKIKIRVKDAVTNLLGNHDLKIFLPDSSNYITIGRGSIKTLSKVSLFNSLPANIKETELLKIGRFCEFAVCKVMLAGEHLHDSPINITFASLPLLNHIGRKNEVPNAYSQISKAGITEIGNNVVISMSAIVLSGSKVPDGSVLAANAVFRGRYDTQNLIYAGMPAKAIRPRNIDSQLDWWNFSVTNIAEFMLSGSTPNSITRYQSGVTVVCSSTDNVGVMQIKQIIGLEVDSKFIPMKDAPRAVLAYFNQLKSEEHQQDAIINLEIDTELFGGGTI